MGIPQVPDRIKEAPALVLRAVFAGVGQLLLAAEKIRVQVVEQVATVQRAATPAGDGASAQAANGRAAQVKPAPRTTPATVPQPGEVPPIPNYGELSLASLRARLRALDEPTLAAMLTYEKAHARRDAVIAMFERRLAKLRGQAG